MTIDEGRLERKKIDAVDLTGDTIYYCKHVTRATFILKNNKCLILAEAESSNELHTLAGRGESKDI